MMAPLAATPDPALSRPGPPALVVLGASARAFAVSASDAGFAVCAADLFADLDLAATATTCIGVASPPGAASATPYPWSLGVAARGMPAGAPYVYTGGLENHPRLLATIAAERPLAGNGPGPLRVLRDWRLVAEVSRRAGAMFPETFVDPAGLPTDGTFIVKPAAGAGGRGMFPWTAATARRAGQDPRSPRLWQRMVAGASWSATALMQAGRGRLVGVARQLVGERWCHAAPFAWCGAVTGPARLGPSLPPATLDALERIAGELAAMSAGVGLVGIDLVVDAAGRPHVLEVNPRPTASMELFERRGILRLAADHLAACGVPLPKVSESAAACPADVPWAKGVLFARRAITVDEALLARLLDHTAAWTAADRGWPAIADIPRPGQTLSPGGPVVSVFARGPAPAEAVAAVRDRVAMVGRLVAG